MKPLHITRYWQIYWYHFRPKKIYKSVEFLTPKPMHKQTTKQTGKDGIKIFFTFSLSPSLSNQRNQTYFTKKIERTIVITRTKKKKNSVNERKQNSRKRKTYVLIPVNLRLTIRMGSSARCSGHEVDRTDSKNSECTLFVRSPSPWKIKEHELNVLKIPS